MPLRNWACSEPTMAPCSSYRATGAVPAGPNELRARGAGGKPPAVASKGGAPAQVSPGANVPRNVSVPRQPSPPASGPVATKSMDPVDGVLVTPGLNVITPVGASGVPPHEQIVGPLGGAAAQVRPAEASATAMA